MRMIKFQKPYLVMEHLNNFVNQEQLLEEEYERLSKNGGKMKDQDDPGDEPKWIQDKPLNYIRTLEKTEKGDFEIPKKAYIVEYNGIDFVISSRENREEPKFVTSIPDELFKID